GYGEDRRAGETPAPVRHQGTRPHGQDRAPPGRKDREEFQITPFPAQGGDPADRVITSYIPPLSSMFFGLPFHTGLIVGGAVALVVVLLALWGLRFKEAP